MVWNIVSETPREDYALGVVGYSLHIQEWPATLFLRPINGLGQDGGLGLMVWDKAVVWK
jgi:hypothetical protein